MAPALHVIAGPGPGQLATMAHPADEPWSPQELSALARAGVQILVSSAEPGPDTAGIEVVPFPISDGTATRDEANRVVALAVRLAREVRAGRFVVTQAAADNGRSTLLATMTLALLGIRPGEALRRTGPSGTPIAPDWLHDFVATHG
ncbi:hypothetical protein KZ829_29350 [Actinoplanes hulinensis]|uniref:Tyrosine phosphatase family protein n=2 Tax=Actinoplanes TaxID=1865 RepID=A0A7W5ABD5_9ACTN|nr:MULTISPECIES: hypothetical protein [Actinoplanes]MBB3093166.1 hypothetical protein [Actinoplanes campanulatus]MBW6437846.1 hypothetical protein [Actinoplanes hulinensis]GGN01634.1 hypothetical protein GCM10010109_07280 [Actinoplanes campanulatus]GID33738.1 hypothetical protein Aca09nite_02440 [Actinoplanes campanulatus]GID44120.1 hypothetical protein Aca07nite_13950 [Actinoplanes capillaceus]